MAHRIVIYGVATHTGKNNPQHGKYNFVDVSYNVEGDVDYEDILAIFQRRGMRFARSKDQEELGGDRITIGKQRKSLKDTISKEEFLNKLDEKLKNMPLREPKKDHGGKVKRVKSNYKKDWADKE